MIEINGKQITQVFAGSKAITAIYKGGRLLWEAVLSCFGKGHWLNDRPWRNDETWRN